MRYTFKKDSFKKINSEVAAYWLGFLYADGNVSKNRNRITLVLNIKDKELIFKFLDFLKSDYKPSYPKNFIRLEVNSKEIKEDLINLSCVPAKSKILKFPTKEQVPEEFLHHFIRGYFDGDGCVWEGKRKEVFLKNSKKRISHNVKFNITGTENVIKFIDNILVTKQIVNSLGLNYSKKIYNCIQLEHSGRKQLEKFYNFLYLDATVFLERKMKKFKQILNICANIE